MEENGENGELVFHGYKVSVWEDEKVLEVGGADGCTTMWMYLMPLGYRLKNSYCGQFYVLYILSQFLFFKADGGMGQRAMWGMVHVPALCWLFLVTKSCPTLWGPVDCACQAPLSMRFPSQEYWSGLPCPSSGDLPNPEMESTSPELAGGFFLLLTHQESSKGCKSQQIITMIFGLTSTYKLCCQIFWKKKKFTFL